MGFRPGVGSGFSFPIILMKIVVASSSTGQSVAITISDPAAKKAEARPLNGGEWSDKLEPVLQADKITISELSFKFSTSVKDKIIILILFYFWRAQLVRFGILVISPAVNPWVANEITDAFFNLSAS